MSTQALCYSLDSLGWRRKLLAFFLNIAIWSKLQRNARHPPSPSSPLRKVTSSRECTERNVLEPLSSRTLAIKLLPASDLSKVKGYRLWLTVAVSSSGLLSSLSLLAALHPLSAPPARWSWELGAVLSGLCPSPLPGIQAACSWNLSRDRSNFTAKGRCRSLVSEAGFAFPLSPPLVNIW